MVRGLVLTVVLSLVLASSAFSFDQSHAVWNRLLETHVYWDERGVASQVDYSGMQRDEKQLQSYLDELAGVSLDEFNGWQKPRQLAFLINAYNAFTVKLILSRYPGLRSIKDLGSFFSSPWANVFPPCSERSGRSMKSNMR